MLYYTEIVCIKHLQALLLSVIVILALTVISFRLETKFVVQIRKKED